MFAVNFDVSDVVLKHGWHVNLKELNKCEIRKGWKQNLWKSAFGKNNQQTGLANDEVKGHSERKTRRQTFPQAPSPTMTSFLRISDII
jgi:hypothetical protein